MDSDIRTVYAAILVRISPSLIKTTDKLQLMDRISITSYYSRLVQRDTAFCNTPRSVSLIVCSYTISIPCVYLGTEYAVRWDFYSKYMLLILNIDYQELGPYVKCARKSFQCSSELYISLLGLS